MDDVLQAVSVVGFPIAMCLWFMQRDAKLAQLITNNTMALQQVCDSIAKCKKADA